MFNNEMVQLLVDLQKKGVHIHLTDEGYKEFLKLMMKETSPHMHMKDSFAG